MLIRTINKLKASGVNTEFAILDASYYDDEYIMALYDGKISFVSRLKELVTKHISTMEQRENPVSYSGRDVYIRCMECQLIHDHRAAYWYIGLDIDRKRSESRKLFARAKAEALMDGEVFGRISRQGNRRNQKCKVYDNQIITQEAFN